MHANKPENFEQNVSEALSQPNLKAVIRRTTDKAGAKRAEAIANFPGFENARIQGQKVKDHTIKYMAHYLAEFEKNAKAQAAELRKALKGPDLKHAKVVAATYGLRSGEVNWL